MGSATKTGTVTHWSPELASGKMYDTKYDMWSMGVVFYELCCLDLPFTPEPDSNTIQMMSNDIIRKIMDENYIITPLPPNFSKETKSLINSCLNRDPSLRADIDDFLEGLNEYRHNVTEEM